MSDIQKLSPRTLNPASSASEEEGCALEEMRYPDRSRAKSLTAPAQVPAQGNDAGDVEDEEAETLGAALNSTVEKNRLDSAGSQDPLDDEAWSRMSRKNAHKLPSASLPQGVPGECERTRLIGEISRLLREPMMPESTRTAGLTLIGWLARRMPGEPPHALGVEEARLATGDGRDKLASERRIKAARKSR